MLVVGQLTGTDFEQGSSRARTQEDERAVPHRDDEDDEDDDRGDVGRKPWGRDGRHLTASEVQPGPLGNETRNGQVLQCQPNALEQRQIVIRPPLDLAGHEVVQVAGDLVPGPSTLFDREDEIAGLGARGGPVVHHDD